VVVEVLADEALSFVGRIKGVRYVYTTNRFLRLHQENIDRTSWEA
jgi:hypothetical protein